MRRLPAIVATAAVIAIAACGTDNDAAHNAGATTSTPPAATSQQATPAAKPAAKSVAKSAAKSVAKPVAKPAAKPVANPVAKPVAEPVAEPVAQPTSAPAPTQPAPRGARTVNGAVDAWLDANAAGDSAAAWAVLAPQSRRAVGSYANFVSMRSALAEGWGAWASANEEPRSIDKVYDTPDGPVRTVTLFGYVSQEGPQQLRATAVLVRQLPNGRYAVSTFEDAGYVDLRMPERDGQVVPGDAVLVGTTEHESTMFFVLDRTLHRATGEFSEEDAVINHSYDPTDDELLRGVHLLTVVTVGPDESLQATAVTFEVR
ncbi:MAG TPA: hypothetical protein VEZ46_12175 [Mycobacteriales bacterium]|jgi:hypothetical protein|nr:hypothetical protein [Mycobacteriales bacterium]